MTNPIRKSARTRIKRLPKRGHFDRETINSILDEAFVCHVGFAVEGQPYVIPTGYARIGDDMYIHGSVSKPDAAVDLAGGIEVCVTVTLLDGFVLARSAFPSFDELSLCDNPRTSRNGHRRW